MVWIVAGLAYAALYAGLTVALGQTPLARLWAGNIGQLIPPLVPIVLVLRRRHLWRGRHLVFLDALGASAALWFTGQAAWAIHEIFLSHPHPWLAWDIVPQFSGTLLPLVALIALPHRGQQRYTATPTALDIYGITLLIGFLFWSAIVAPGTTPDRAPLAAQALAVLGPGARLAVLIGFGAAIAAAQGTPWVAVYRTLAAGAGIGFVLLTGLSASIRAGTYQTGSPLDAGWILQFWFYAAAIAAAPASGPEPRGPIAQQTRTGTPLLLFGAILAVPIASFLLRAWMPLGEPADTYREIGEDVIILGSIGLGMVRVVVEQRIARRFERRVRLLAAACEQTSELIIITRDDRVHYANTAFCRALGYSQTEIAGVSRESLVSADSFTSAAANRADLDRGEQVSGTVLMRRRDGTSFAATISAEPLAGDGDSGSYSVAVVHDLTDELRMREQLVRSERLSAVGELVSSIAHQINNPLQSVVGTVDVLLAAPTGVPLRGDLEHVRLEAWRAGHIIRNLLSFVRKTPGERLLGELNEIVESTMTLCAHDLVASGIRVVHAYGANLPLVLVNREEIQQIVLNLVANAQQSLAGRAGGGTLTVRTYMRDVDAVLEVEDDGPGVPTELASRIFEPFVTTKDMTAANGFGLSTAFGIAAAHSGTLELVPGDSGACFRLTLPGAGFAGPVVHSA